MPWAQLIKTALDSFSLSHAAGPPRVPSQGVVHCLRLDFGPFLGWHVYRSLYGLASATLFMGEFAACVAHAEPVFELYDPQQHHILTSLIVGHDPGAQCLESAALSLWMLGLPDQARQRMQEALNLAEELAHPYTRAWAYHFDGLLQSHCRDWPKARESAETVIRISDEHGYPITGSHSTCVQGLALAKQGQVEDGIALLQRGISECQAADMHVGESMFLAWLGEVYLMGERIEQGLDTLAAALDFAAGSQESFWEAEIHRLTGKALLSRGDATGAETSFFQALAVARRQRARSWELRTALSLARLWKRQGKRAQAHETLAGIYGWFSEGFDTADLRDARALLAELSGV